MFKLFSKAVKNQFDSMGKNTLYVADISKDVLWSTYLDSFPQGTNPIYKERTEHDCNCCKGFISKVGHVVSIIDGEMVTVYH